MVGIDRSQTPILLTGSGTVTAGALSSTEVGSDSFRNRTGVPIFVDGIRFVVSATSARAAATANLSNSGASGLVRIALEVGRHQITRPDIPIGLCCRWSNFSREIAQDWIRNASAAQIAGVGANAAFKAVNPQAFTWRFAKPLYLPNSQSLTIKIRSDGIGAGDGGGWTVETSVFGRRFPGDYKPPDIVPVPYATYWADSLRSPPWTTAVIADSTAVDLINPFQTPLFVKEFRGNHLISYVAAVFYDGLRPFGGSADSAKHPQTIGFDHVTVQMINSGVRPEDADQSTNNFLVRDFTPWNHLFMATSQGWIVNTMFSPSQWAHLRVKYLGSPVGTVPANVRFSAGMVGYRMVYSKDLEIPN